MARRKSNRQKSNPKNIELMDFLIKKTKNVKKPLEIRDLAEEYRQKKRSSRELTYFSRRIDCLVGKVGKSETIDTTAKVKMMFAFSTYVGRNLLDELCENADVELDEYTRITKYRAHDGSLNLKGEHPKSVKTRSKNARFNRISESTRRVAPEVSDNSAEWPRIDHWEPMGYASLENYPLNGYMEILNHPGVQFPQEPSRQPPNSRIRELREPKHEMNFLEAIEAPEASVFRNEAVLRVPEPPGASDFRPPTRTTLEANDTYTPQIKFLDAIQSLILTMNMPSLTPLQAKTEKHLHECSDGRIPNNEMSLAMELFVTKMINNSVSNLSEDAESVNLNQFLCYLKTVILSFKLGGLENLVEKIEENIREPESKDKNIPVEKMTKALQDTLNNAGF